MSHEETDVGAAARIQARQEQLVNCNAPHKSNLKVFRHFQVSKMPSNPVEAYEKGLSCHLSYLHNTSLATFLLARLHLVVIFR